jgi:uncharacterized protein YegL
MLPTSPLDAVIKKIDENAQFSQFSNSSAQKIVFTDIKGKPLSRKPFWGGYFSFLVSTKNVAEFSIPGFEISDFGTRRCIPVSIGCKISCPVGHEAKIASKLSEADTPAIAFENKVNAWLDKEKKKFPFDVFSGNPAKYFLQIKESVENKINSEIGLVAELSLSFSRNSLDQLKSIEIKTSNLLVLVLDYNDQINLGFKAKLIVEKDKIINAILSINIQNDLEKLLKEEIRNYFRKNISLYDYCYNLVEIRSRLIEHLDNFLAQYGREIEYLLLEIDKSLLMPEVPQIKYDVVCDIQEYPESIIIKNKFELEPRYANVAVYHRSQITDLQNWFKSKLEKIVKKQLFDSRYTDLSLNFEPIARNIRERLEDEAKRVGYSVRLITTTPDLPIYKLRNFSFKVSGIFSTKYYNVQVKLEIIISGKIKDLSDIKDLINSRVDIESLMIEKVHDSVSQLLHTTEPEHFYFHFEYSQEGKSVKTELIERIARILESEFYASEISVIPKMLDTDLTERFHKLQNQLNFFEIVIDSLRDLKESVTYRGSFRIERVAQDKWHIFQAREHSINEIQYYLERFLLSRLKTLASDDLKFKDPLKLQEAEESISALAQEEIAEQFGVELKISALDRLRTDQDNNWNAAWATSAQDEFTEILEEIKTNSELRAVDKQLLADQLASKRIELQNLQTELQGALTLEGNEDEIENIQEKIESTQAVVSEILGRYQERSKIARQRFQTPVPTLPSQDGFDTLRSFSSVRKKHELNSSTNTNQQLQKHRKEALNPQDAGSAVIEEDRTSKMSEPRFPIVLLLDTSVSMSNSRLNEFEEGFSLLQQIISQNEITYYQIEIAVITLGGTPQVMQNFSSVTASTLSSLRLGGINATGQGIELALSLLDTRLQAYKRDAIRHYPAWLFMITASVPDDSWSNAAKLLKLHDERGDLSFFTVALPGINLGVLREISPPRIPPVSLKQSQISQLFSWLSEATTQVTNSPLGSTVNLPDISSWAQI